MPIAEALAKFKTSLSQCDNLIANAHQIHVAGQSFLPPLDREQITVAAFLNLFIAWETFLEESLANFMAGATTVNGRAPVRYVVPPSIDVARAMVIGNRTYFDYANNMHVRTVVKLYFKDGDPYEPHLAGIDGDLNDLKTMRNSAAHMSTSTQTKLEGLALRIFGSPRPGVSLYQMLTSVDPRSTAGETVILSYKNKLIAAAELISNG
jgi:hypothetical protein